MELCRLNRVPHVENCSILELSIYAFSFDEGGGPSSQFTSPEYYNKQRERLMKKEILLVVEKRDVFFEASSSVCTTEVRNMNAFLVTLTRPLPRNQCVLFPLDL